MTPATESSDIAEALERAQRYRRLALMFQPPRPGGDADLVQLAPELQRDEGEYHLLLGPSGVCPASESEFELGAEPLRADVAAFYRAFNYEHPEVREVPDHVAVELGFLAWLAMKEAYARYRGQGEEAEICREAARRFQLEHLGRWVGRFLGRLHAAAGGGLYARAA
jgi:hypothetical protein